MAKRAARNLLVGLDIGTSKVVCIVGELTPDGQIDIVGIGSHPARGLKRGVVVNIEATTQSIRRAVEEAELMAGCRAHSVYVGISGGHIRSHNSVGVVPVRSREVSERDVDSVMEAAGAMAIPADQKVLHVVPQEFVVDGQEGIQEPVGMFGVRLEAKVHIVTGSVSAAQNLQKCVESCGLAVERLCLQHMASAAAVLQSDERELGICVVDIGGGTSDIAVFRGGSIRHSAVVPVAGDQVSNDISVAFRTPTLAAEDIKIKYGCALPQLIRHDEGFEVPGVGETPPRRLSRLMLAEVIRPRYEELFRLIRKELHRSDWYDQIAGGVVLTGGAAQMAGAVELAEEVFELPVRLGLPQPAHGLREMAKSAGMASAVGLLQYAHQLQPQASAPQGGAAGYWLQRVSQWFKGNF